MKAPRILVGELAKSWVAGYDNGLEAAALMHDRMAQEWYSCSTDASGIEANQLRERARVHSRYARKIRNLKKGKVQNEETSQEETQETD